MSRAIVASLLLLGLTARAEGQVWSEVGARTVPARASSLAVEAGWPQLDVRWLHGVAPGVNVGLQAGFSYGLQGQVTGVVPGLEARALLKARLLDTERVSLAITFEPGAFFAGQPGISSTRAGLLLPVGLRLGVAASSAFAVGVLVEVPLWLDFSGGTAALMVPILSGVGLEYFVTSQLALFARVKLGPTLRPSAAALFTLDVKLGVAFEF